jgi:cystathionine beta-lyase/cystathionine gamma-synthase
MAYDFGNSTEQPPYDHRIVRLNIGLEATEDLIADLEQSLEALPKLN